MSRVTARVRSKGQVALPRTGRDRPGIEAGSRIEFIETKGGFLVKPTTRDVRVVKGALAPPAHRVTIDDMNRAAARMGWTR